MTLSRLLFTFKAASKLWCHTFSRLFISTRFVPVGFNYHVSFQVIQIQILQETRGGPFPSSEDGVQVSTVGLKVPSVASSEIMSAMFLSLRDVQRLQPGPQLLQDFARAPLAEHLSAYRQSLYVLPNSVDGTCHLARPAPAHPLQLAALPSVFLFGQLA